MQSTYEVNLAKKYGKYSNHYNLLCILDICILTNSFMEYRNSMLVCLFSKVFKIFSRFSPSLQTYVNGQFLILHSSASAEIRIYLLRCKKQTKWRGNETFVPVLAVIFCLQHDLSILVKEGNTASRDRYKEALRPETQLVLILITCFNNYSTCKFPVRILHRSVVRKIIVL